MPPSSSVAGDPSCVAGVPVTNRVATMICTHCCGEVLHSKQKFCGFCGHVLPHHLALLSVHSITKLEETTSVYECSLCDTEVCALLMAKHIESPQHKLNELELASGNSQPNHFNPLSKTYALYECFLCNRQIVDACGALQRHIRSDRHTCNLPSTVHQKDEVDAHGCISIRPGFTYSNHKYGQYSQKSVLAPRQQKLSPYVANAQNKYQKKGLSRVRRTKAWLRDLWQYM